MKKLLALLLAACMVMSLVVGCSKDSSSQSGTGDSAADASETKEDESTEDASEDASDEVSEDETVEEEPTDEEPAEETEGTVGDLPRTETLYIGGYQWGEVATWNPVGASQNNFAIAGDAGGSRSLMFETLYMYDFLTGTNYPLLADGDPVWNDDMTEVTVNLKAAAHWSDGTDLTAADVVATWDTSMMMQNPAWATYEPYIAGIEADGDKTVVIKATLNDDGTPVNPLRVQDFLSGFYICQAAWLETLAERNNNDPIEMINDVAEDVVYSGPYGRYFNDIQKVVLVRDDNYWGQDASMWGSLPVPKYVAHNIYADNAAVEVAFRAGEIDVSQNFFANIQNLWLEEGLPISTFYEEAPYGVCLTMPTAFYNMNIPVLKENVALRKAIALAVDYDAIIANAMTNQSPTFDQVPRSVMNPTDGEQALYDHDAVADLQWKGNDIEGAIALLDEAGLVDTDGDGIREWNGENISLNCVCPNGWNDWQAAMEIVAAAGEKIGIDLTTMYPEWSVEQTVFTDPDQTEYDIFMYNLPAAAPSCPWARAMALFSSDYVGIQNNWSGNWGQYVNEEADEILKQIPTMTDEQELIDAYTRLTEIYLTEVPSFSLMYRPANFDAVNETVWTNYPSADDGRGITPNNCVNGYAIRALYELELAE